VAPEYIDEGDLTYKCDVFSFGVILLEIVRGRKRTEIPTTFLPEVSIDSITPSIPY
jgi:serine/threonine protein kinase